jgi:hypothetical protein
MRNEKQQCPVNLIAAIQANLNAFKRALLRERQFAQVIDENKDLRSRIV